MNREKSFPRLAAAAVVAISAFISVAAGASELVGTFAADCQTPKSDFNLGETVCARVSGSPTGFAPQRLLNFVNPAGIIVQSGGITADPQIVSFTLPATSSSTFGLITVDNRRTWRVVSVDTADIGVRAAASFAVHDPTQATVDLEIYKEFSLTESDFNSGSQIVARVFVQNFGPSAAQNVQVSDSAPTNSTFVSVTQETGPTFNCVNSGGDTTCSIATMANGAQAIFKFTYDLTSNTVDTQGSAGVTTSTFETDSTDNSSTVITDGVGGGGTENCTIGCPANVTQNNDGDQAGAIVNYPAPTLTGTCDTVTTDPPSGSFFPIGTTTVTVSDGQNSCAFTVTVVDARPLVISLNGANPMTVECHTSFVDPGATAHKGNGDSVPVTTSGTVDANTPGTYVLTYSATDGTNNVSVTRTVNVVDTTPPNIILNGSDPMTVECHTAFVDPGATAVDSCAGTLPVTATGTVDANTPGTYVITYTTGDGENTVSATRTVNVVDTTPPVITCPTNVVATLPPNTTATSTAVTYPAVTAVDACSSTTTVTSSPVSGSVFSIGDTVVTANATDPSANSSQCHFLVSVHYLFTGFFPPINNLPTVNAANAGRSIPVKFSLSGNKGLTILAADSPASGPIPCNSTDPVVDLTPTDTAGNSTLTYDAASDTYTYVWSTQSSWSGTCRQLVLSLNDGTSYRANFKFK